MTAAGWWVKLVQHTKANAACFCFCHSFVTPHHKIAMATCTTKCARVCVCACVCVFVLCGGENAEMSVPTDLHLFCNTDDRRGQQIYSLVSEGRRSCMQVETG